MQHFWHQKHIFGFSTSAGVLVEEKPNAFREMLGDETSRKFPAMFVLSNLVWPDVGTSQGVFVVTKLGIFNKTSGLLVFMGDGNQIFLMSQNIFIHVCGEKTRGFYQDHESISIRVYDDKTR